MRARMTNSFVPFGDIQQASRRKKYPLKLTTFNTNNINKRLDNLFRNSDKKFGTENLSRSKFPVCAVEKRAVCENLSVSEAETHQHKDEVESGSALAVLHGPPFRQVGTGRQHRGLKGEK